MCVSFFLTVLREGVCVLFFCDPLREGVCVLFILTVCVRVCFVFF